MKGTLHKTESGWHVINMQATLNGPLLQSLPLIDNGHIDGLKLYDSNEGLEVEFEVIDNREICDCICHKNSDMTHFISPACCNDGYKTDNLGHVNYYAKIVEQWVTIKEGDITVNFKPMPKFDDPKYTGVMIICPRCKDIMPCACNTPGQTSLLNSIRSNASWDSILKEFISANSQTKPLTFECWLIENYNPPTKKEDHDK